MSHGVRSLVLATSFGGVFPFGDASNGYILCTCAIFVGTVSHGWVVQYLKERFDVPVMLLPALSELVASLVFRQARALVLGYNGSRVKKGDRVWREKVSTGAVS